ncbi:AP180 N-terminal homology (ANTH) domain [Dillenia turbinata]|uniref:AP180 N-terminal homology (ANTH) domain n=1 Tax=Dillenia turbinata TaxID=194707 RepID=A0AAN8ZB53_9MAGN
MRLWRRASGALKDKNSIIAANLARRTSYRHPDLEAAIIKATSHDESSIDYKNVQRVYAWIRTSPSHLKPLLWALSMRLDKTRDWVVAIKGLMLLHGVFCCRIPAVKRIGRLPFDLSDFNDGHSKPVKTWGRNIFIRAYFAYLDQKSMMLSMEYQDQRQRQNKTGEEQSPPLVHDLVKLQQLQGLLDMLLQLKPQSYDMHVGLIREAMDCIVIEIFDIYSKICYGIARVLVRVYSASGKLEAAMALKVLQKATVQGENLILHFELCRDFGLLKESEFPKVERIPEEDFEELERIINGVTQKRKMDESCEVEEKAMIVMETRSVDERLVSGRNLKTVITDKWEVFEEDHMSSIDVGQEMVLLHNNPFADFPMNPPLVKAYNGEIPDLISFL